MGKKRTTLLIDTDVLCHQMAYSNTNVFAFGECVVETVCEAKAKNDVERFIIDLLETLRADNAILVLSDRGSNFRKELDPTYKARRSSEKPTLWNVIRGFVESRELDYPAVFLPRLEGDDVLGILATGPAADKRIIVSIDKDMQTIPALLYNPRKPDTGVRPISERDAFLFWMKQTLTGDTTDDYPGCPSIGEKRATAILDGVIAELGEDVTDSELMLSVWKAVVATYESKGKTKEDATHQARLARILRFGEYNMETKEVSLWHPTSLSA